MNQNSNVLIVGATGYIGALLHSRARLKFNTLGTSTVGSDQLLPLNFETPSEFNYTIIRPSDVVFITAAISAPDICAREYERAWAVNVKGTSEFIAKVIEQGARVIFFSSDTVYGERADQFDELASCNPAGEYAAMKHAVERKFLGHPSFKVIRLSYVFSREDKFTQYLSGCELRDEKAEIFHPFYRAVVHRDDVIDGAIALAECWDHFPQSIVNFGGPKVLARTEFAEVIKQTMLPRLRFSVTEPAAEFFKNRPRVIAMQSPVFPILLGHPVRTLFEAGQVEFTSIRNNADR